MTWRGGFEWDITQCRFTDIDGDGFPSAQPDSYGENKAGTAAIELHHTFGFASRPLDPDGDNACQMLIAWEGSKGHAFILDDARTAGKTPRLSKGASAQHNALGSFGHFENKDLDGTWTLYVPVAFDGETASKAHVITVGLDGGGKRALAVVHADGMGLSMLEGGKNAAVLKNKAGDAFIGVNDDGVILSASAFSLVGTLMIGAPPGVVPPVPLAFNDTPATVCLGDPLHVATAQPLVRSVTLLAYLAALEAALAAHVPPIVVPTPIATLAALIISEVKAT